ncbi:uncharacterized protein LOC136078186 [Hydra vulgaris]|uniref:Uncharacterized protein LOC136078186 n=1 Tax=Hydra vulgaris TaxID=6087 RepID=A0ABM4BK53_HYDVU
MSVGSNKEELVKFLLEEWKSYAINEIEIFITHGDSTYCFRNSICTELSEHRSDQEEADTRLLLHCKHASVSYAHVILASPDTDVFVSALYHSWFISATLHFETRCGNKQRILNVNKIAKEIGYDWCDAMIGLHSFAGCDAVSAFQGKGKLSALKTAEKKKEYCPAFRGIGMSLDVSDDVVNGIQKFVCHLYGASKEDVVNKARYYLFKMGKSTEEILPPNYDSFILHIKRANYDAYIRKNALKGILNVSSPDGYGWSLNGDQVNLVWTTIPPAPDSLLEFVHCSCKLNCVTNRCSYKQNGITCIDLCACGEACENTSFDERLYDDDDDDDETESESNLDE